MKIIDVNEEIEAIEYDDTNIDVSFVGGTLTIASKIKGDVIDSNFTELDTRLSNVESQIRMRLIGEINRLTQMVENLQSNIPYVMGDNSEEV